MGMMLSQLAASRMRALPMAMLQGKLGALWNPEFDPGWRRNLLTYSEDFSNAVWVKNAGATVTGGAALAPDGASSAALLVAPSTWMRQVASVPAASIRHVFTIYAKAAASSTITITEAGVTAALVSYNLSTGTLTTYNFGAGSPEASITDVGSGWYRCTFAYTTNGSQAYLYLNISTSSAYIWGAQLERGTAATAYQRITDVSTEYIAAVGTPMLWQEGNGSFITPVTALEQSVGAIFDPTKGLAIGSERVANTTFSTADSWTLSDPAITISGGALRFTACPTTKTAAGTTGTFPAATVGVTYRLVVEISSITAGTVRVIHGGSVRDLTTAGTHTLYLMATGASGQTVLQAIGTTTAVIESVSCKAIAGVHLYAPQASRGVLSARFNLLTATEEFNAAAWTKTQCSISHNAIAAPNGELSADKIVSSATTNVMRVQNSAAPGAGQFTMSYSLKAGEWRYAALVIYDGTNYVGVVYVDLATGTILTKATSAGSASISAQGNGWYRVTLAATCVGAFSAAFSGVRMYATNPTDYNMSSSGDGISGIYAWGADLRLTADTLLNIPAYPRVNTATDYDYQGFPIFINCAGSRWYTNPAVDLSGTDKLTVFAGVTKMASGGMIMESSTNAGSTAGAFYLYAPDTTYHFRSTTATAASLAGTGTPPHTAFLVGLGNISGDSARLRVNGVEATPVTTDQGTGNYTSQPFYLGARGGSSLFFNGRFFCGGLLGENASQAFLENLGRWSKQRMKVSA